MKLHETLRLKAASTKRTLETRDLIEATNERTLLRTSTTENKGDSLEAEDMPALY